MIPRVRKDQFLQLYRERRPVIVVDALDDWPARATWTPDHLASVLGQKSVSVGVSADGHFNYNAAKDLRAANEFATRVMRFDEAASMIARRDSSNHVYVMQQSIVEQFPELLRDIATPPWISSPTAVNLWFGNRSVTPLHNDESHNCFAQIYGQKTFTLFSPHDMKYLYPLPLGAGMCHVSRVDPEAPNVAEYPQSGRATPYRFTLEPGDMLFMPGFWWHHVRSLEVSISVNFFWDCEVEYIVQCPNSLRDLYGRYEVDRLASINTEILKPNELTFASAAYTLLQANHRWAATLMAVAAFDEFVNRLRSKMGVPNTVGCRVRELASDIKRSCAILCPRGALSDRHIRLADRIGAMSEELSSGNEVDLPNDAAGWLVRAVQSI